MLEIKNTVTEMESAFDGLIHRFYTTDERINEIEERSIETFQIEIQKEKRMKQIRTFKDGRKFQKLYNIQNWNTRRRKNGEKK